MKKVSAQEAANARWRGGDFEPATVEQISTAVLASWCARAELTTAAPTHAGANFHFVVTDANLAWTVPVMVRGVARDGFTVAERHLEFTGVLVWVMLGRGDGGLESRDRTSMVVLDPRDAWALPARLGSTVREDSPSFRWPSMTKALREVLAEYTATSPEQLRVLLAHQGWRKTVVIPVSDEA